MTVPALTVNKVCLSGLDAIALASQLVRLGECDAVVAGGMESMTQAPHLLPKSRRGYKYGPVELLDSMAIDGLTDAFDHVSMGESTEQHGTRLGITREEQDEFAALSHQRAATAIKNGLFADEIVGVEIQRRGAEPLVFDEDEGGATDGARRQLGHATVARSTPATRWTRGPARWAQPVSRWGWTTSRKGGDAGGAGRQARRGRRASPASAGPYREKR